MAVRETAQVDIVLSNGQKAGQTINDLTAQSVKLNREIKKLKPGTEEFTKKSQDLQKVNGRLKEVRNQVRGVDKANRGLLSSFSQFLPFGGHIQQLSGGFSALSGTVGNTTGRFKAFKIAIASTGIGLLVVALGSLVTWLTSTQSGLDKLTSVTRPLSAIFQRFIGLVQELGGKVFKGLVDAIKDPRQAIIDLGNALKDNLIARIESIGVFGDALAQIFSGNFKEGFKGLADATIQFTAGIRNGTDKIIEGSKATKEWFDDSIAAGQKLDQIQKQIEKTEIALAKSRGRLTAQYEQQKEIAQDQSRTEEERLAAARSAQEAQNQLLAQEQNLIDLRIEKMKLEHTLNDTSRADLKELAELEGERERLAAQAARKRASAHNLENTIVKQVAAEQEKQLKREAEIRQNIQDLRIETMEEGMDKEIAIIEKETQRKLESLEGSEEQITEQRLLIEEMRQQRIQGVKDEYAQKEKEKRAQERKEALEEELENLDLEFEERQLLLEEQNIEKLISEEEYREQLNAILEEKLQDRIKIQKKYNGEESAEVRQAENELFAFKNKQRKDDQENLESIEDKKKQILRDTYSAFKGGLRDTISLMKEESKERKAAAQVLKGVKTGEVIVSGIKEVQGIWESVSTFPPPLGPILGAIMTAAAVARTIVAITKIQSTKFKFGGVAKRVKASLGSILRGKRHSQGGIPIEAEDGEIILTRGVSQDPKGLAAASALNQAYGGVRFMQAGGVVSRRPQSVDLNARNIQETSSQAIDQTVNEIRGLRQDINNFERERRVVNSVQDTREKVNVLNKLESDAAF